jgi:5-(carboxyamino)imidazole ribonucleotide synthase
MRIGIVGSGQLGRMIALSAAPLGHEVWVLGTSESDPALAVARGVIGAGYDDAFALTSLAGRVDVVTYEFENVPAPPLAAAVEQAGVPLAPPLKALATSSDRWIEKQTFEALQIPTAPFASIDSQADLDDAAASLGLPLVLKTRRLGYDGKGQRVLRSSSDVTGAFEALGAVPCIAERFVDFLREVSLVAARSSTGEVAFYPLAENVHRQGILYRTVALDRSASPALHQLAETHVRALLTALDYVGVMAIEMFEARDGTLIANEIAPRVHNTGHWTQDGAVTSQFEQHVRAITGAPLGDTTRRAHAAMVNLVGTLPDVAALLAMPDVHLHLYGKSARPGRKLGHVNVLAPSAEALSERLGEVERLIHWA